MFTGLITDLGRVRRIDPAAGGARLVITHVHTFLSHRILRRRRQAPPGASRLGRW
jgi:hypothetical protein